MGAEAMGRDRKFDDPTQIVEKALSLIERDGYGAFSTRKLAAELGMTAMAVYTYFPTKDDLLKAVVVRGLDDFVRGFVGYFQSSGGQGGQLRGFRILADWMAGYARAKGRLYEFLFFAQLPRIRHDPEVLERLRFPFANALRMRSDPDFIERYVRHIRLHQYAVNALIVNRLRSDGELDEKDFAEMADLAYRTILGPIEEEYDAGIAP